MLVRFQPPELFDIAPALAGVFGLWETPASRHEAACASGSVAVLAATAEIEASRYDCVLVLAVEQERNVPGAASAGVTGAWSRRWRPRSSSDGTAG